MMCDWEMLEGTIVRNAARISWYQEHFGIVETPLLINYGTVASGNQRNDSGQVTSAGKLHPQVTSAIEAFRASAQGF